MQILFNVREATLTPDLSKWVMRYHPGDVIQILADSHAFSERELTNPAWRIVKVGDLTVSDAEALESPEIDMNDNHVRNWRRTRNLDLGSVLIPPALANFLADDSRPLPILEIPTGGRALLTSIAVQKPPADTL